MKYDIKGGTRVLSEVAQTCNSAVRRQREEDDCKSEASLHNKYQACQGDSENLSQKKKETGEKETGGKKRRKEGQRGNG